MSSWTSTSSALGLLDQLEPEQRGLLEELVEVLERPRLGISESELLDQSGRYRDLPLLNWVSNGTTIHMP